MQYYDKIVILDFGSQYTQLIARRIREQHVYTEIVPYSINIDYLKNNNVRGLILSGGPSSVFDKDSPHPALEIFEIGIPILGICYGMQLISYHLGGKVAPSTAREYGYAELTPIGDSPFFRSLSNEIPEKFIRVWMSHGDRVTILPEGFKCIGKTNNAPLAAIADEKRKIYGIQFHPEVAHTPQGSNILSHFAKFICGCKADWNIESFIEETVSNLRKIIGDKTVLCALSGGVDSSVLAILLNKAIGKKSRCIFVDNGLLRKNEIQNVIELGKKLRLNLKVVNAKDRFLQALTGVSEPELKRKIIGEEFVKVFFNAAEDFDFLAQGTLYPDVIESISTKGPSATIKTHHNRVPEILNLIKQGRIIEPLKELFKDEVRQMGLALGLPEEIVQRHPFPGPGLAIRLVGEITKARLELLRDADAIVREEIIAAGWYEKLWQAFAILLSVQSVGVMGDQRTYDLTCVIRAVESKDAMTANWARLPSELLASISHRIINEIEGINRVLYDISNKPPATIEWE